MNTMRRRDFTGLVAAAAFVGLAGSAFAQSPDDKAKVDAAKAAGVIGEQADGMLGLVGPAADPATQAAMAAINNGRAQVYREAAARNNVSVEAAGASTFQTVILPKVAPGQYYKPAGSGWVRK
jgi:uncharacterized protein YdbL (DUF1318 family)